jgi:hypothetical protein
MYVTIDQPRRQAGLSCINRCRRSLKIAITLPADRGDQTVVDDYRIGLKHWTINIA